MGGRRSPEAVKRLKKMITTTITVAMLLCLALAAKKKPTFGQLTLTGQHALDWLKTAEAENEEGVTYKVAKLRMVLVQTLIDEGWNVPDWKEPRTWTVLLFLSEPEYANPIWVHQRSAVMELEKHLATWEEQGAQVDDKERSVDFADAPLDINFRRGTGKFARYVVSVEY